MKYRLFCTLLAGAFFCLSVSSLLAGKEFTDSLETQFVDGGEITVKLTAGEHEILASPDNQIRVHWRVNSGDRDDVDARTDVNGSSAIIDVDGPRKNFHTVIEVPQRSDLTVRLSAGELHVGNVEGDRDIKLRAGDLNIEVSEASNYAHVEGSLWAGDISAGPFDEAASGLFRSIEWNGAGEQELKFRLYAGEVRIYQAGE